MSIVSIVAKFRKTKIIIFCRKTLNSYFTPTFLWRYIINDYNCFSNNAGVNENKFIRKIKKLFNLFFWFWPTLDDASFWRDRNHDSDDLMGAHCYIELDDMGYLLMEEVVLRTTDKNDVLLDLGCNAGRSLNYLLQNGYNNIHGVDISTAAIETMKSVFPDLPNAANIKVQTMQEYLLNVQTESIDVVYTYGATVELIPSTFPLIKEISRICKGYIVFLINENGHYYPRFWEHEFKKFSFDLIKLERPFLLQGQRKGNSLLVFKKNN